jgi:hypothetical protein
MTTAAGNYASGIPASMSLALDWIDNDLRSGLKNGTLGGATIDFLISQGVTWNGYNVTYGRPMICYEGNYEPLAPTTAQCTSVFSIATSYSASIQNLIAAYKSDVRLSVTMLYLYQKFFALSQAKYAASYVFGSNSQWGMQIRRSRVVLLQNERRYGDCERWETPDSDKDVVSVGRGLEHVSAEQNRKVSGRIKGFPRGCLWVSLLALILFWRLSDAKLVFCRDA